MPDDKVAGWHGFARVVDFLKALGWILSIVLAVTYGVLIQALDDRYALKHVEADVHRNGEVVAAVGGALSALVMEQILENKGKQCREQDPERKQWIAQRIQVLAFRYRQLTGNSPEGVGQCDDLR